MNTEQISPDTRRAWEKLHGRLQAEGLIPEQEARSKSSVLYPVFRIAAVALLLLGITAVIYFLAGRKPGVEMVNLNTGNETGALVKTLSDGSVIYLAQSSSFSYPITFESSSRRVELNGEAFFDVAPDPAKPFIIETEEAIITVLGTAFDVRTGDGKGFELLVDRGTVSVALKTDPSRNERVTAGEKVSAIGERLMVTKQANDETDSWYRQRMHFKDEALANIITVLNRNYNTNFVLAEDEIGMHRMTVTFQDESPETITELICVTLNLRSQTIHGAVVLSENKEGAIRN